MEPSLSRLVSELRANVADQTKRHEQAAQQIASDAKPGAQRIVDFIDQLCHALSVSEEHRFYISRSYLRVDVDHYNSKLIIIVKDTSKPDFSKELSFPFTQEGIVFGKRQLTPGMNPVDFFAAIRNQFADMVKLGPTNFDMPASPAET